MRVVFDDLNMATYLSFDDVIQINQAYHKVNGRMCKGFWLTFDDTKKQDFFVASNRYSLHRVEV